MQDGDASKARIDAGEGARRPRDRAAGRRAARGADRVVGARHRWSIPKARFGDAVVDRHPARDQGRHGGEGDGRRRAGGARRLPGVGAGRDAFREFGLGFNPKLVVPAGQTALPYYGYGDAVVRLSLGDNKELAAPSAAAACAGSSSTTRPSRSAATASSRNGRLTAAYR